MLNSVVIIGGLLVLVILALSTVLAKMFRKPGLTKQLLSTVFAVRVSSKAAAL